MKTLMLACSILLIIAMADMPIGYYSFLRIAVTLGAVLYIVKEIDSGVDFWIIAFGIMAIIFNPIIPIYLNDKDAWMPIDIVSALLCGIKGIRYTKN